MYSCIAYIKVNILSAFHPYIDKLLAQDDHLKYVVINTIFFFHFNLKKFYNSILQYAKKHVIIGFVIFISINYYIHLPLCQSYNIV